MADPHPAVPDVVTNGGRVIDGAELDAGLIIIRLRGSPHLTGGDLDAIHAHYGKSFGDLDTGQQMTATAYVYLCRKQVPGASWEMARDECAIEYAELDPTNGGSSETSPSSAGTGGAPPVTSTA